MPVTVEPITPAIGAIVSGVDLSQPVVGEDRAVIEAALLDRLVLFFRDQDITRQQQRDFAATFGPLHIHPIYPSVEGLPEVLILDSAKTDLVDNALWHSDVSFAEYPPLGAVLAAHTIPPLGGDTLWTNAAAAYDALPEALQAYLGTLSAIHDLTRSFPVERFGGTPAALERLETAKRNNPPTVHPVIRTHPVTGRKAIYVSEAFTTGIVGLDPAFADPLLRTLFAHVSRPEFSMRWKWREGDVALWDNRVTQHYASNDYLPHHRLMYRATIIGDRPV